MGAAYVTRMDPPAEARDLDAIARLDLPRWIACIRVAAVRTETWTERYRERYEYAIVENDDLGLLLSNAS